MLELKNVTKAYDAKSMLLQDINLSLAAGSSVAIMGASGSGKSTLLNMIAGLVPSSAGAIYLHEQCMTELSETARDGLRARHIGMVFQQFNLIDCLSVADNIALPARYLKVDYQPRFDLLLAQLGIGHLKHASIDRLSGGEQQRVAIARALIHQPALILADEPTGNLDENTSEQVADLLFSLAQSYRAALVVVTHAKEIAARAGRCFSLTHGTLVPLSVAPQ